jgi:hypothetical protein
MEANSRRHNQPKWAMSAIVYSFPAVYFAARENPVQHGHDAGGFGLEALESQRNLLRSLLLEVAGLSEGRTDTGHMEEDLLEHAHSLFAIVI